MVAILLATYNGSKYLSEQIDSILSQTYQEFRIFIHDDGSADETVEIINRYVNSYPDKIVCVDGPAQGSSKENFLFLLKQVEADYYMFCDQDDYWLPDKVERSLEKITSLSDENDLPLLVFSDNKVVDAEKKVIDESFMHYNNLNPHKLGLNWLIMQNCAPGCTMLFNRKAREESLKYTLAPAPECIVFHDCWIILVVAALGRIGYIDTPLMLYRQHGNNVVGACNEAGLKFKLRIIWWLISMSHVKSTKQRIRTCVMQGIQLQVLDLQGESKEIVDGLCAFFSWNKIERTRFVIKHKIYRTKRNLWQILCL